MSFNKQSYVETLEYMSILKLHRSDLGCVVEKTQKTVHLYDVNKCLNIYAKCIHWQFGNTILGENPHKHTDFFSFS